MKHPSQEAVRELAENWLRQQVPANPTSRFNVSVPANANVMFIPGTAFVEAVVEVPLDDNADALGSV